jgi:hypothetical protein
MTQPNLPEHFFAIDWSGSASMAGQRRHIAVASWKRGDVALETGFTREEIGDLLVEAAAKEPCMVIGLDFAFSFPAWWVRAQGCADVFALWALAARRGECWLSDGLPPFWGRPGQLRPRDQCAPKWLGFRRTDRFLEVADCAIRPKSPFQIGGAGAVGTGSVRGMPLLGRLHQQGFHVWPFDDAGWPLVLEIYPRLFTGPVVKSDPAARAAYLRRPAYARLPVNVRALASASEDAFDALISVMGMAGQAAHLSGLSAGDSQERLEGLIWAPSVQPA